jgi:hypothetical protein
MTKRPLVWTADDAFNHAFSAQVTDVTYHVATQDYGYPARVGTWSALDSGWCSLRPDGSCGPCPWEPSSATSPPCRLLDPLALVGNLPGDGLGVLLFA